MRLTDEHEAFRATVRNSVNHEINPQVDQWELDGTFPAHDLFPRLAQYGLLGLEYDPTYGGEGADHLFTLIACEEYGRIGAAGVAMAIGVQSNPVRHGHSLAASVRIRGSEATFPRASRRGHGRGSDRRHRARRKFRCRDAADLSGARRSRLGHQWTQALHHELHPGRLALSTRAHVGRRQLSGYAPDHRPDANTGFQRREEARQAGQPVVGHRRTGLRRRARTRRQHDRHPGSRIQTADEPIRRGADPAYTIYGQCRYALKRTRDYLLERQVFGGPLAEKQYVAFRLAEFSAQLDLLHSHNSQCAQSLMAGEDVTRMATVAKLTAGRLARDVADMCLQFHGGLGYMEEKWTARFFRDMRLSSIGGGADEGMLKVLARLDSFPV